ncbi:unnamed protein product, partial [Closterium sp. Yama58-4]
MPPPKPITVQLRPSLALSAALWLTAFVSCHAAQPVINATQAVFLNDCQKAWETFPGWAMGATCGNVGVKWDASGMITSIYLPDTTLGGSIPNSISSLTSLTELNVTGNQLTGSIPAAIGKLTNLTHLSVRRNALNGPIPDSI